MLWFDQPGRRGRRLLHLDLQELQGPGHHRYSKKAEQAAGRPAGSVMTFSSVLDGQEFTALNRGPHVKFNEAISLGVHYRDQEEVDYYWDRLTAGATPARSSAAG